MSLIIFNKKQEVGFQRFALSVFSGATLLVCLGVLHSVLYDMPYYVRFGTGVGGKLWLIAAGMGIILAVMYFNQDPIAALSKKIETNRTTPRTGLLPKGYEHAGDIRRLFAYVIAGDVMLFGIGMYRLVWVNLVGHVDLVLALGALAVSIIGIFLPLHYAAMLKLDICTEGVAEDLCAFAQERFSQILYWVLVVYWASILAGYAVLLLFSQEYCHMLVC